MVGYTSHFAIGLLISFLFVAFDKKDRYKTLLIGGFAAVAPDIDGALQYLEIGVEHRGFFHSFELWAIITALLAIVVGLAGLRAGISEPATMPDVLYDAAIFGFTVSIAWFSHLIADFGFTDYQGETGWWMSLQIEEIWLWDSILGFMVTLILGFVIWHKKPEERSFHIKTPIFEFDATYEILIIFIIGIVLGFFAGLFIDRLLWP